MRILHTVHTFNTSAKNPNFVKNTLGEIKFEGVWRAVSPPGIRHKWVLVYAVGPIQHVHSK